VRRILINNCWIECKIIDKKRSFVPLLDIKYEKTHECFNFEIPRLSHEQRTSLINQLPLNRLEYIKEELALLMNLSFYVRVYLKGEVIKKTDEMTLLPPLGKEVLGGQEQELDYREKVASEMLESLSGELETGKRKEPDSEKGKEETSKRKKVN
jgi:hypothetical protein